MRAAMVTQVGMPPVYGDFIEPTGAAGEVSIAVTAAALSQLTRSRASGKHYSSSGQIPFVVGIDGAGKLEDGRRVYFVMPKAPLGSMAERVVIRPEQCVPLPADLDDVTAAAIANPGMSSWAALKERAKFTPGETVLVNGATGTSGRLAVQIAKYLGARRVIATGRNPAALNELPALGADVVIPLTDDADANEEVFKEQFAGGIDVVLDYLWGPSVERLLITAAKSGKDAVPIRFIHIGSVSANDINLPGAVLRSSAIQLMGSGLGSIPLDRLINAISEVLAAAIPGGFKIATQQFSLSQVGQVWGAVNNKARIVFTI